MITPNQDVQSMNKLDSHAVTQLLGE